MPLPTYIPTQSVGKQWPLVQVYSSSDTGISHYSDLISDYRGFSPAEAPTEANPEIWSLWIATKSCDIITLVEYNFDLP
jgi:hypothetical protein